jgi:hypothetical protein
MTRIYAETGKGKAALKEQEYQNRVLTITLCYWLLKNATRQIQLSFTYDQYFNITKEAIVENSETIADSDGLALANCRILADPAQHSIKKMLILLSKEHQVLTTSQNEGEKATYTNKTETKLFFINFSKVHQDYHKEYPNVKVRKWELRQ